MEPRPAAEHVNSFMTRRLDNPGSRIFRNSGSAPLVDGSRKCFLRSFFGDFEITDQANQGGDDPAPIGAIQHFDGLVGIPAHSPMVNNFLLACRFRHFPFDIPVEARTNEVLVTDLR